MNFGSGSGFGNLNFSARSYFGFSQNKLSQNPVPEVCDKCHGHGKIQEICSCRFDLSTGLILIESPSTNCKFCLGSGRIAKKCDSCVCCGLI